MSTFVLNRSGYGGYGPQLQIVQDGVYRLMADPQHELGLLGIYDYCLKDVAMSFLYGLECAGERVFINISGVQRFQARKLFYPPYALFGFAWARGEWSGLKQRLLRHVVPCTRREVLRTTFIRAFESPYRRIEIALP